MGNSQEWIHGQLCRVDSYEADRRSRLRESGVPRGVYPVDPNLSEVGQQIRFSGVARCEGHINRSHHRRYTTSTINNQLTNHCRKTTD